MNTVEHVFTEVRSVVAKTIGIDQRIDGLTPESSLAGLPEFDSMAVLDVMLALEAHFGIVIDDDDVSGDLFETLGTLAAFVESKLK